MIARSYQAASTLNIQCARDIPSIHSSDRSYRVGKQVICPTRTATTNTSSGCSAVKAWHTPKTIFGKCSFAMTLNPQGLFFTPSLPSFSLLPLHQRLVPKSHSSLLGTCKMEARCVWAALIAQYPTTIAVLCLWMMPVRLFEL